MISVSRLVRWSVRLAAWATPHVKEWHRKRHFNSKEGQRNLDSRNWTEAEKHFMLALAESGNRAGKPRVELLLGLERAQRHQHKLAEAEKTARDAIELAAKSWNPGRPLAMESLVDLQIAQSKYAEAEQTVKEIQQLEESRSKPDYARLARCSRRLADALLKSNRPADAMKASEMATQLSEKIFGPNHLETANALAELGALHRQQGNHAEAQSCVRRALKIHRAELGADSHPATEDLHMLATSLHESGDLAGAMGEYERVIALRERQVGGNREDMAQTQVRLAILYLHADRVSAARELLIHAVGTLERTGGDRLRVALETMASAEERSRRPDEAARWREKAAKLAAATLSSAPV